MMSHDGDPGLGAGAYLPRPTRTMRPSLADLASSLRTFATFMPVIAATSVGDIGSPASRSAARTAARSPEYRTLLASPSTVHVQVPWSNWTAFSMSSMSRPRPCRVVVPELVRFSTSTVSAEPDRPVVPLTWSSGSSASILRRWWMTTMAMPYSSAIVLSSSIAA